MERTKLKGIPFSSPPVGAVPLGRAKLLLGVQMARRGFLCIALPRCHRHDSFSTVKFGTLIQDLAVRINWLIQGLPRFLSIQSTCQVQFYLWLCWEMSNSEKDWGFCYLNLATIHEERVPLPFLLGGQHSLMLTLSRVEHMGILFNQWFSDQAECLGRESLCFKISVCSGVTSEQFHFALNIY